MNQVDGKRRRQAGSLQRQLQREQAASAALAKTPEIDGAPASIANRQPGCASPWNPDGRNKVGWWLNCTSAWPSLPLGLYSHRFGVRYREVPHA